MVLLPYHVAVKHCWQYNPKKNDGDVSFESTFRCIFGLYVSFLLNVIQEFFFMCSVFAVSNVVSVCTLTLSAGPGLYHKGHRS